MEEEKKKSQRKIELRTGGSRESVFSAVSSDSPKDDRRKSQRRKDLKTGTSRDSVFSAISDDPFRSSTAAHSRTSIGRYDMSSLAPRVRTSFSTRSGDSNPPNFGRSSLRTAVFDLTPLEEKGLQDAAGRSKGKGRRTSPFSQDPRKRQSQSSTTPSASALDEDSKNRSGGPFHEPLQLIKGLGPQQKSQIYLMMKQADMATDSRPRREPANVHTVTVPKKGLIKLTGLPYEFDNPQYYDDRKERPAPAKNWEHTKFRNVHRTCPHVQY